jgi:RHS repeat-associated protein
VEQVNVTSSPPSDNPVFLTYTPSDSSWLATNSAGDELSFWRYDAYGTLSTGTPDSPFGYAGQYTDASPVSSGFSNMRARWYQAQTGQFTTWDPAFNQTDQAYDYAGGDPVNNSDPSGDWCINFAGVFNIACWSDHNEPPVVICSGHAGDEWYAATQIANYYDDTVGLRGFFAGPTPEVVQTLAVASAGAVLVIYDDEFFGLDSWEEALPLISATNGWGSWSSRVNNAITAHGLAVFAVEETLNQVFESGLPVLAASALDSVLTYLEPNPNPIGSYNPNPS